jgi:carbon-monoxide dehydrogenase medium subunit
MKPAPFRYHVPRSKADALSLLAELDNARLLAGGQSLVPMLNFRLVAPDHLIDLNRIPGLDAVEVDGKVIAIGAMARQRTLESCRECRAHVPLLADALTYVGHVQTRNRGTLGGSLCHLDPAAELVTAAAALEATLVAESRAGSRRIAFDLWSEGFLNNSLQRGEMLVRAEFPIWPREHGYAFREYARRHGDFAIVCVAALLTLAAGGRIARAAVAIGGCASAPQRLRVLEQRLVGAKPDAEVLAAAARMASAVETHSDPYVSADYRRHLAGVLTERALIAAAQRAAVGAQA